jgi:hypothetical protein
MFRTLLAVPVGYLTLGVLVILAFSLAALAPDFALRPGTLDATRGWIAYTLIASALAAAAGGAVAARIGRGRWAAWILAGMVLLFGLVEAARNAQKSPPNLTAEDLAAMSVVDKAKAAVQPGWYALALPFLGAAGVLVGGTVAGRVTAVAPRLDRP